MLLAISTVALWPTIPAIPHMGGSLARRYGDVPLAAERTGFERFAFSWPRRAMSRQANTGSTGQTHVTEALAIGDAFV
jgi:hypothetical protein